MKKQKLFEINQALQAVSNLKGVEFAFVVAKNLNKLNQKINLLIKIGKKFSDKEMKEYQTYETRRIQLAESNSKKDSRGNSVKFINSTTNQEQYEIENRQLFENLLKNLKNENKEILEKKASLDKENDKLLEGEIDFEFHKIKKGDLPEEITASQLEPIMELIEE